MPTLTTPPTPTPTLGPVSGLSTQQFEQCGSFWLSVASTIAWPTLLTLLAFFYLKGTLTYSRADGGKLEYSTIVGVVDHRSIGPGQLNGTPEGIVPACCTTYSSAAWSTEGETNSINHEETGFGSFGLLLEGYPIRSFVWITNSEEALSSSVQLVRKIFKKPVLAEEEISISKLIISLIGFVFGLVGLLRNPREIPDALRTIFDKGAIPDIRVFLLFSTVASVSSFILGILTSLVTLKQPTARLAAWKTKLVASIFWAIVCVVSFVVGCIQINDRRQTHRPVWPMFIYWAPSLTIVNVNICGLTPLIILAMVGVVLGIVAENQLACQHH